MSFRKNWPWGFAIVAAILILIAIPFIWHVVDRIDPKSVEATIDQNLNPGTDLETVTRYLENQGIRHSRYDPDVHELNAVIDQSSFYGIKGRIRSRFRFDENRKLVSHEVFEMYDFL